MLNPLTDAIQEVISATMPMVIISIVVAVSLRITYILKNHLHFTFYKEVCALIFIVYILCLFQIVSSQDVVSWSSNNFIPFKEITRYTPGSSLFFKNVLGNLLLFMPFGLFVSYYLKPRKIYLTLFLTLLASLSIELVQLSIGRVFDIDDILLNVIGGILGYFIYSILSSFASRLPNFTKSEIFLNILSVILSIGLIVIIFLLI